MRNITLKREQQGGEKSRLLRALTSLLALFVSFGISTNAIAQTSTVNFRRVVVTAGSNSATATAYTYDAVPISGGTTIGGGIFAGTDFGAIDAAAGTLLLQGGSIQVVEANGEIYDAAYVDYAVSPGTLTSPDVNFNQQLPLVLTGYDPSTGTRTFSLTNGARNILAQAATAGSGTSYRFDIGVRANGTIRSTDPNTNGNSITINSQRRRSVFNATGTPTFTPTLTATTVYIAPNGASNVSYDANSTANGRSFDGANLGSFDVNTGQLLLNGGTATTTENSSNTISSVALYYRVRQTATGGPAFQAVTLTQTGSTTDPNTGTRTRTFALSTAARNLLLGAVTNTSYNVDVYFQASGANTSGNTSFNITDDNGGMYYVANFTVAGTPTTVLVWTGSTNDNWFDPTNWNPQLVPTAATDCTIPNFPANSNKSYPNIYSGVIKPVTQPTEETNPDGTKFTVPGSPGFDNTNSGPAEVRNLTLQGVDQLDRSILRLVQGRLNVYGNFDNPQGSFIERAGGILSFKADGNQTISGSINGFIQLEIDGGVNSIKTLTNSFDIKGGGYIKFINGILQTDISRVSSNFISLAAASTDNTGAIVTPAAQIIGESETSYLRGFITTTQQAAPNAGSQDFGNIGLTLTFTGNDPGPVTVTRNTGGNYTEASFNSTKPSIRRVFGVQPGNPNAQTGGLNATVQFNYLNNELSGLRTSSGAQASDDASKLALYVSTTGGNTFSQLGRDSNINNTLTKSNVTTFATFTLSEQQTPLPVKLVALAATRTGSNTVVTWNTASEINNAGFEVQVSTNGTNFRELGFVPSRSANSNANQGYVFTDTEAGKAGLRYYRLRQVDLDGQESFSPVRAVSFYNTAIAGTAAVSIYPNPSTASDQPTIVIQSPVAGAAHVQVLDITGRSFASSDITTVAGLSEIAVPSSQLSAGVYLVKVTLPSGETKTVRMQKR